MKTSVVYATKTRYSKKLAEAIGSYLNVQAQNITEKPTVSDIDLLFIVGDIYGGVSMPELFSYIKKIAAPLPKYAALVTSCASGKQRQAAVRLCLEEKGITVLDEFVCRGSFLFVSMTHPNTGDLKEAADFAQKVVNMIRN